MKADALKNGIRPRRGMWVVSHGRRRVYGRIEYVRRATIATRTVAPGYVGGGATPPVLSSYLVDTDHETIHRGDYDYVAQIPAGYTSVPAYERGAA